MNQVRGAVIGCGRMGAFTTDMVRRFAPPCWFPLSHCEAMVAHPDIVLAAICDTDPALLERARQAHAVPAAFTDYREMIARHAPDVVGIATRTPERPGIIEDVVRSGVRALHVEKPLCNAVAQLVHLEDLLAPPTIACTYGTIRRYFPVYGKARGLAAAGQYGALQQVRVDFGPGRLLWTHPHAVDLLLFLTGDRSVKWVSAQCNSDYPREGSRVDGDPLLLSAILEFEDGVTGVISQSGGTDVTLSCAAGAITVESDGRRIRTRFPEGEDAYWNGSELMDEADPAEARHGGTMRALDRLVRALRTPATAEIAVDKRAIFQGQRVLFACLQSHLSGGARVDPAQLDPDLWVSGRSGTRYA